MIQQPFICKKSEIHADNPPDGKQSSAYGHWEMLILMLTMFNFLIEKVSIDTFLNHLCCSLVANHSEKRALYVLQVRENYLYAQANR